LSYYMEAGYLHFSRLVFSLVKVLFIDSLNISTRKEEIRFFRHSSLS
jgi:hypothetical protein